MSEANSNSDFAPAGRNRLRRLPQRGSYDQETIYAILDAEVVCHVAFVEEGQPFVIPMLYARDGDALLLHGASAGRLMKHIGAGEPVSISVAILDGLVLAKSAYHHSVNYRSVVLFGRGRLLTDAAEKLRGLEILTEHLTPGRWAVVRPPSPAELNATAVAVVHIESASAKVRVGPPGDAAADLSWPAWAGVLPLTRCFGEPVPADYNTPDCEPPTIRS